MSEDEDDFPSILGTTISEPLSRQFKANPTIDNYLKLRNDNPGLEIEVAVTGGLDWLLANDRLLRDFAIELREHGHR